MDFSPQHLIKKHNPLTVEVAQYKPLPNNLGVISFLYENKRYTYTYNVSDPYRAKLRWRWGVFVLAGKRVFAILEPDNNDKDGFPRVTGVFSR